MRVENKRTYTGPGIYVGRPSRWGNPWSHIPGVGEFPVRTRDEAISRYHDWLTHSIIRDPNFLRPLWDAEALICWCAPLPCHAEVLREAIEWESGASARQLTEGVGL